MKLKEKLSEKLVDLWVFGIANRKQKELIIGGFKFVFRSYTLDISSISKSWSMRLLCSEHPYGYLLASLRQGNQENLHGYAMTLFIQSTSLTKDQKLVKDVQRDCELYMKRLLRESEKMEKQNRNDKERETKDNIALMQSINEDKKSKL